MLPKASARSRLLECHRDAMKVGSAHSPGLCAYGTFYLTSSVRFKFLFEAKTGGCASPSQNFQLLCPFFDLRITFNSGMNIGTSPVPSDRHVACTSSPARPVNTEVAEDFVACSPELLRGNFPNDHEWRLHHNRYPEDIDYKPWRNFYPNHRIFYETSVYEQPTSELSSPLSSSKAQEHGTYSVAMPGISSPVLSSKAPELDLERRGMALDEAEEGIGSTETHSASWPCRIPRLVGLSNLEAMQDCRFSPALPRTAQATNPEIRKIKAKINILSARRHQLKNALRLHPNKLSKAAQKLQLLLDKVNLYRHVQRLYNVARVENSMQRKAGERLGASRPHFPFFPHGQSSFATWCLTVMGGLDPEDLEQLLAFLKGQPDLPQPIEEILHKLDQGSQPLSERRQGLGQGYPEGRYPTPSSPMPQKAIGDFGTLLPPTPRPPSPGALPKDLPSKGSLSGPVNGSALPSAYKEPLLLSCDSALEDGQMYDETLSGGGGGDGAADGSSNDIPGSGKKTGKAKRCRSGGKGKGGNGIGKKAKEGLLGRHGMQRRSKAGGNPLAQGGAPTPAHSGRCEASRGATALPRKVKARQPADPALQEQVFKHCGYRPSTQPVPEDQPLSDEAHHFILDLSLICHQFLHEDAKDNADSPLRQVVQLLECGDEWQTEKAAKEKLNQAFATDSLECLALRCSLADQNVALNSFSSMLNTVQFRCGVVRKCQGIDKSMVLKGMKSKFSVKTLTQYVLDGAKFCLLAGGGTIFILAFASAARLQPKIRALTHDAVYRVYNLLRCPNPNHVLGKLVIKDIIPAINELQRRCRISFSSLFDPTLLVEKCVIGGSAVGDMTRSDEFFDKITYNVFLKPRDRCSWAACLFGDDIPKTVAAFHVVDKAVLSANRLSLQIPPKTAANSPLSSPLTPMSEGSDCEMEAEASPSTSPTHTFVINTNYDPDHQDNQKVDFTKMGDEDFRFKCTEKERLLAEVADQPMSLDELENMLQAQLESGVKQEGSYVNISHDCFNNMRLKITDKNGKIILVVLRDLPEEKRSRLLMLLKAVFPNKMAFTNSKKAGPSFTYDAAHFDYWNVYSTHGEPYPDDVEPAASLKNKESGKGKTNSSTCIPRASAEIQSYSEEYHLLQECFKDIFHWVKEAVEEIFPEDAEVISQYAKVLPAEGFSPVYPFSGFVVNLNVCTRIHKDSRDLRLCLVMAITDEECVGGDLCLKEPGIRLAMRSGDAAGFPSHLLSHYNTHFKGERASLVFHTDINGQAWVKKRNGWNGNIYMNMKHVI